MEKAEQLFSNVHDTQRIYRQLLDVMARPGKLANISDHSRHIERATDLSPGLIAIALTLIDREVTFAVHTVNNRSVENYLQVKTMSQVAPIDSADYVFIEQALDQSDIESFVEQMKAGTLQNPHLSSTVILRVEALTIDRVESSDLQLTLSGPGIKEFRRCFVRGFSPTWLEARYKKNKEFPIGIDMILVTGDGDMMALPRTTKIESLVI